MRQAVEPLESRRLLSATFYVATTGSDSAAGTQSAPFKTIQRAADLVKAGGIVHVAAGNYAGFAKYGLRGTAAAPISFIADGAVNITTKAPAETQLNCGIELSGFDAGSGCAWINLTGFNVNDASGTITGANSSGLRARFSNHVTITGCTAQNCGWVGIYGAYVDHLTIDDCRSIANNLFVDSSTGRNHGIYIANSSTNCTVSHCLVSGNHGNGLHLNGDGGVDSGFTIDGNSISGSGANGGSAINCDGLQNSSIVNNLLTANLNKGIALYNIDASDGSSGNLIANNTVVMPSNAGNVAIQVKPGSVNNVVVNNVFDALSSGNGNLDDFYSGDPITCTNNVWSSPAAKPFASDGSFQAWADFDYTQASAQSTPALIFENFSAADYRLSSTSPARGRAKVGTAPAVDLEGAPRTDPADCGCYAYARLGDVNGDGLVTGDDISVINAMLGQSIATDAVGGGGFGLGDINHDGIVTGDDYSLVISGLGLRAA